ncbi:MAG: hypothetical protein U5L06_10770 [Rhodovibrio sp.]|nr:hypothetical protein [Rhodovibrio sp.]
MAVVDRRVDEARDAVTVGEDVAAPHVAVQAGGMRRLLQVPLELAGEPLDPVALAGVQAAALQRDVGHVAQAMVAEEVDPAVRSRVRLVQRPDQRVALQAVGVAAHCVQAGDVLGGVALGGRVQAAAGRR